MLFKHYEYKILTTFRFHYFHRIMGTKYRHHSTIPKISIWIPAFTTEKYLFHQNISVLFSRIRLCGYIFFLSMLLWQLQNMARMVFRSLKCADVIQLLWLVSEFLELCTKIEVIMEKRLHGLSTVNYQFKLFPLRFHK